MWNTLATSILFSLFSTIYLSTGFAGQEGGAAQGPPESMKRFEGMLGRWSSKVTGTVEGKPVTLDYRIAFKKIADGSALYAEESFDSPDLGAMRGGNLIGFDPGDRKIHWFSADNMGTAHEHIGDWQSPTCFQMRYSGTQGGKSTVEEITVEYAGGNKLQFHLTATLDGRMIQELRGEFVRR